MVCVRVDGVPNLRAPVEYVDGRVRTVDQESDEHVSQCIDAILLTPIGSRPEKPEFGIPDTRFGRGIGTAQAVHAALDRWEPRTTQLVEADRAALARRVDAFIVKEAAGG